MYEFLRVVTHPRVFDPPTDLDVALEDLESLLGSSSLVLLGEGPSHAGHLERVVRAGRVVGNLVHDEYVNEMALRRVTTARDIANAVVFLASDDSANMTGQSITVDGGWDV